MADKGQGHALPTAGQSHCTVCPPHWDGAASPHVLCPTACPLLGTLCPDKPVRAPGSTNCSPGCITSCPTHGTCQAQGPLSSRYARPQDWQCLTHHSTVRLVPYACRPIPAPGRSPARPGRRLCRIPHIAGTHPSTSAGRGPWRGPALLDLSYLPAVLAGRDELARQVPTVPLLCCCSAAASPLLPAQDQGTFKTWSFPAPG